MNELCRKQEARRETEKLRPLRQVTWIGVNLKAFVVPIHA